jgi:hypothetical protein
VQQQFLPDELTHKRFWNASDNPSEAQMQQRQNQRWGDYKKAK